MSFSRRHYRLVSPAADTPAAIAERFRARAIAEQVQQELTARWPTITAENADEVLAFQRNRYEELIRSAR